MFNTKKTLIVVYKDELLMNQLKKMIETRDDVESGTVGTKDDSINVVSWTEKVWLGNKKAGNIQGKILFLGDVKGTDKLIPVIDVKFNDCGVKYGWAGNQAVVHANPEKLTSREQYNEFLKKLFNLPIPSFLKSEIVSTDTEESEENIEKEQNEKHEASTFLNTAKKAFEAGAEAVEKVIKQVLVKSEEIFRNKTLMKRQMLFYGAVHLYNDGLERFMNQ